MIRKSKNRGFRRVLMGVAFFVVLGGGIGFLAFQNIQINNKRSELQENFENLEAQVVSLTIRKTELEEAIGEIDSVEYQEKLLREQGLYQKPGEEVITVLREEESANTAGAKEPQEKKRVWWNPFTWF